MDRKVVIFLLSLLMVFGVFAQIGFCNGGGGGNGNGEECTPSCPESCPGSSCPKDCNCDDTCSSGTLTSTSKITYYYAYGKQKLYDFGTKQYYSSPPVFTDKDYYTYSCYPDGCGGYCCTCCGCHSDTINCKGWQKCIDDDVWGCPDSSTGCVCVDEYCKGWCMDNAPAYDGLAGCSPVSDGDWVAFEAFPFKPEKYKLNKDYHPAYMGGGCYCNYYEINDTYECDDAFINDSHPCASGNCAPSFEGGKAVCLPDRKCWWDKNKNGAYDDGESFDEGSYIIEGYNLTCKNGKWFFRIDDNAGETLAIELWNNTLNAYPKVWDEKKKGVYWGLEQVVAFRLSENRDIFVYTNPKKPKNKDVYIKVYRCNGINDVYNDNCYLVGNGKNLVIVRNQIPSWYMVKLTSNVNTKGYRVNVSIDTFLPEARKECKGRERECGPLSFCAFDNINFLLFGNVNFYCCPIGKCYYNNVCYPEGMNFLNVNGEMCNWKCENGKFRKLEQGEVCSEDCECRLPGENDYGCSQVLQDRNKKVCCPIKNGKKGCAIDGKVVSCVEDGISYINEKDGGLYTCNNGVWEGGVYILKKENIRVLLKKGEMFNTSFEIEQPIKNSKLYIFFDDSIDSVFEYSLSGVISQNWNQVPSDMEIYLGNINKGEFNVSIRLKEGNFGFIDGIVLYGER